MKLMALSIAIFSFSVAWADDSGSGGSPSTTNNREIIEAQKAYPDLKHSKAYKAQVFKHIVLQSQDKADQDEIRVTVFTDKRVLISCFHPKAVTKDKSEFMENQVPIRIAALKAQIRLAQTLEEEDAILEEVTQAVVSAKMEKDRLIIKKIGQANLVDGKLVPIHTLCASLKTQLKGTVNGKERLAYSASQTEFTEVGVEDMGDYTKELRKFSLRKKSAR